MSELYREPEITAEPDEDDDPESLAGEETHYADRETFPEAARFTDGEWEYVELHRGGY